MLLNILYLFFIQPIEFWMEVVLKWGFTLAHSWGWALVLLSLVVNTVILPIYNKAEGWQEDERKLKRGMSRHEAMLRRTFKGQQRFALLSTLRRQYGYTYFMSLRASVGLLLQIPFFFAAYHLLSHYEALYGQPFGPLADLGAPDALLSFGGLRVNLLPIAMTVVNLASAFVYTRALTRRDRIQAYGMAALFLVLLYNSPAALTLYWTLNNLYSLGKNLVEKWWLQSRNPQTARTCLQNRRLALLSQNSRIGDTARVAALLYSELVHFIRTTCYGFGVGAVFWLVTCLAVLATYHGNIEEPVKSALTYFTGQCILTALLVSITLYFYVLRQPRQKLANHPLFLSTTIAVLFLLQLKFFKWGFELNGDRLFFDMWNVKGISCFILWSIFILLIQIYWNKFSVWTTSCILKYPTKYKEKIFSSSYIYIYIHAFLFVL